MEKEQHTCPICGQPTFKYMGNYRKDGLCYQHGQMKKEGKLSEKDGILLTENQQKIQENPSNNEETPFKCLTCGRKTKNGLLFCYDCYSKFKDKELLLKITKCSEVEVIDESYEGRYQCKDGHIVKSKSEREIDNFLFDNGIPHAYERAISIDENENHNLHPDFFLPNFKGKGDVYIEHWGLNENNRDYHKSKKYKLEKYKEKGLTIICTFEKDMKDPIVSLTRKLEYFKENIINFDE